MDALMPRKGKTFPPGVYRFDMLEEILDDRKPPAKHWLVKGLIASGETSAWIAPPGGMKSALMAELAVAVSNGTPDGCWHGRKVPALWGVLYFALERADLVKRRLRAHFERMGPAGDETGYYGIAVVRDTVNLMDHESASKVVKTVRECSEQLGPLPRLLIFDTFAKTIAAGGGNEDKAQDQGKVFANIQRIKDALDPGPGTIGPPHVALIGHTGKDESRGARGSNAFYGDADLMVEISGKEIKTATVTKANDMPEGPLFSFRSETHEFGKDEDGDPITVNIVSAEEVATASPSEREPKLTANQKTMFAMLHDAGASGLLTEDWNEKARQAGIGIKRRADLTDIRTSLKSKGLIREMGDRWTVRH
ncbi:AAA family ATPase [Bradyrhizobium elkanii]|uniref:Uncharacterized protein n=1 Tax=Bradyrhizobium elkanii TaxID=29448 RepID=A0A8I2C9M7_BRAEL|nr:AAA family ATPase [Bradyrhizobium elkanii]MBP1297576.1 hypothetical protein [Bradyrhizobium elkanii]